MVMHVELQATCSALGYQEGSKYIKEPDCLETVKDLIRFLKREEDCDIRRQLGEAQIVQNDLLPLLKNYHKDAVLFDTLIRLLVNLTQPAILCFQNQIPTEKSLRNYYLEIESHLQDYKEAFVDDELFSVLTEKLGDLLKLDWEHRQEEDKLLIERLLILIRNVLHVPPTQTEQRTDDDASTHDQVIWSMHSSGLEDLLLYIASSDEERQFSLHVLEIVSLMFREQTPEMLASAGVQRSYSEKEKDERELEMIREQEKVQKQANVMKFSSRHSRFGGTFVVKNMKSISDRDMIAHKMHKSLNEITFDVNKKPKKKAKNLQPIKDQEVFRRSTLSVRLGLKEFCIQFLENCYNPLMYAVKDILARERSQDNDETYYMWSLRFFMEFCRLHSKQVELVSETMSVQAFHYLQVQLFNYYEMIMTEKKEAIIWGKRVHLALKAYQELLLTLDSMDKSKNTQLMESSKVIKSNVFYTMEFRDIYFTLLKKFNQSKQSRTYLKDLVETTHLFLKMLEQFSKEQSHMVVQTKKTKKTKKKKKQPAPVEAPEHSQQELDDMWDEISGELSALFQGRGDEIPTDVTPFDAASEIEVEQQRVDAMIRIQDSMREKRPAESVALLRAAREVWPERNEFGAPDITPEEEFMSLREIFMANLPRAPTELPTMPEEEGYEDYNEVEEEEMESVMTAEKEFEFKSFVNRFAKPEIMKAYVILLSDFQKNSVHTNHCIIKMLHRVTVDLGYTGMVFQASLFRIFQKIMLSPLAKVERYKEIVKFGTYIVRKFVEVAQDNKKLFMELLFWKGNKESVEVIEGYGSYQSKGKVAWTEEQETELRQIYEEVQHNNDPEKDVAETIMERLTDSDRTRPQIIRELKRQGLISSAKELKKNPDSGWPEELQMELRNLFEQFKEQEGLDKDIADCIKENLSDFTKSRNHIIRELKRLELITSAKELKRKTNRRRKHRGSGSDNDDGEGGGRVTATGPWTDDEESELTDLFTKYNSSDDPLGEIMSKLTVKRSKKKIIEKLLSLGLIDDRKEVYKKRQRKNKKKGDEMGDFIENSDSDSDNNDDDNNRLDDLPSDSEDERSSAPSSDSDSNKESESEDDLDLDVPATSSGAVDMKAVIKDVINKGYIDQIKWIQRAMRRAAEDITRTDNDVSVPIVPLTEENETAMEDERFLSFLRKIGICPPANEQEMFWRIPSDLRSADLLNIVEGLELDEDGEPINAHKIQVRQTQNRKKSTKDKKKKPEKKSSSRFNALKEMAKKRKTQQKEDKKLRRDRNRRKSASPKTKPLQEENTTAHDNDESSNDVPVPMEATLDIANNLESSASKKKSRIRRVMDSDSEDSAKENIPDQDDDQVDSSSQSQKRPLVFADSSDEEDSQPSKRLRPTNPSDSEDDIPLSSKVKTGQTKQTKSLDSDDSDVPLSSKNKKDEKKKPKSKSNKKKERSSNKRKEQAKALDSDSSDEDIPLTRKSAKPNPPDSESSDEDIPLSKKSAKSKPQDSESSDEDMPLSKKSAQPKPQDSDSSDEDEPLSKPTEKSKTQKSDSSDDDDTPLASATANQTESFPATLFTQGPYSDSDSDVNDHVPLRRVLQKKNVIESDDDE